MTNQTISLKLKSIIDFFLTNELLTAVLVTIAIVVVGLFLGTENNKVVPINPTPSAHYVAEHNKGLSFMSDWDGPDYLHIAKYGYKSTGEANFFPLYPLITRGGELITKSYILSALIVAWVFLVGAVYFFIKIIKYLYGLTDNLEALKGVLPFILFPTGVFLIATYTESLLAFLALGGLYFAFKKRYMLSGLFLLFATASHITGVFAILLILGVMIEQRAKLRQIVTTAIIGMVGLASYMLYLGHKFDKPLAFISAQKSHGWLSHASTHFIDSLGWLNIVFVVLILLSAYYWWSRRKSFALYSLLFLAIPIVGGQFGGFNRYVLMDFPLQIMLYDRYKDSKFAYTALLCLSVIIWALFLFQYAGGYVGG